MLGRRSILIGLGGIVAGGGALLGTGAFSTVQAERTATVETAGDADALLQLHPATDGNGNELPNAQYARLTNGTLELDFTGDNDDIVGGGEGFNIRADTAVSKVFEVRNQGTQEVEVTLRSAEQSPTNTNGVILFPDSVSVPGNQNLMLVITAHNPPSGLAPITLGPGEKQHFSATVSVRASITDTPPAVLNTDQLTIQAEATQ